MRPDDGLQLTSARLLLRDFRPDDLADVHAMRSDPEVARFMLDFVPEAWEASQRWLDGVIGHNRRRPRETYNLAIVHRDDECTPQQRGMLRTRTGMGVGHVPRPLNVEP